jgi:hypothetical protein
LTKGTNRGLRRWRAVALLAVGMTIGVVMVATPAGAHVGGTVGHLWNDHIKPKADARYANAVSGTDKAKNADKLDNVDSSGFQSRCNSGATTAYALIDASDYPADSVYRNAADTNFTCSGQTVRVKHTGAGAFTVDFGYNRIGIISFCPHIATATVAQATASAIAVVAAQEGGGPITFDCVYNVLTSGDIDFNLVQSDPSGSLIFVGP